MKKVLSLIIVIALVFFLLPTQSLAASASFSISGPSTLSTGQIGTYTVKVLINDAAAAQATLNYDSSFFELVSGNTTGVWDIATNTSAMATLITVTLRCKTETGTSGSLSLSNYKVSRLTGSIPPTESVSCGGASKTVSNPVPTPTATPTATPTVTPKPSTTPKTSTKPSASTEPSISPNANITVEPTPSTIPEKLLEWPDVEAMVTGLTAGGVLNVNMQGKTEIPASVLTQLRNTGGVLDIDFGNYICKIDSSTLKDLPADMNSLDLSMSMVKDELLSQTAGGFDVYQLNFNYHGELPGIFTYKFYASENKPGDTLYLYYSYEQAGIVEGMQSAIVDADGYVTFDIYHCSKYFVSDRIIDGAINNLAVSSSNPNVSVGISIWIVVIFIITTAMTSVLGTMYFCKTGLFKVKNN